MQNNQPGTLCELAGDKCPTLNISGTARGKVNQRWLVGQHKLTWFYFNLANLDGRRDDFVCNKLQVSP